MEENDIGRPVLAVSEGELQQWRLEESASEAEELVTSGTRLTFSYIHKTGKTRGYSCAIHNP